MNVTYLFKREGSAKQPLALGIQVFLGDTLALDLDVVDGRWSNTSEDSFLVAPTDIQPYRVLQQTPAPEQIAPGAFVFRNMGGYNVLVADVGGCLAIVDTPAAYESIDVPFPAGKLPNDVPTILMDAIHKHFGEAKVCWLVPTHHHGDHLGGAPALAKRTGAQIVTASGMTGLILDAAEHQRSDTDPAPALNFKLVDNKVVLGEGPKRLEIHLLRGNPHVNEMLFAYLPGARVAFEGDIGDYVLPARDFRKYVDREGLKVDRVYGVHNSSSATLADLEQDGPAN